VKLSFLSLCLDFENLLALVEAAILTGFVRTGWEIAVLANSQAGLGQ